MKILGIGLTAIIAIATLGTTIAARNFHPTIAAGYYRTVSPAPTGVPGYSAAVREKTFTAQSITSATTTVSVNSDCPVINSDFCAWKVNSSNQVVAIDFGTYTK